MITSVNMTDSAKKLGKNIRKLRLERTLTQGGLSKKVGVDTPYLSNVENGNKNPTLATIEKIAKALGVSIEELMK